MPTFYLEPSALLKRYKSELGSEVVAELFDLKTDDDLFVTSHLSVLEVVVVAARLLKGGAILAAQHRRLVGTFIGDLDRYQIVVLPLTDALVPDALELLPGHPLRAADALHVSTARRAFRASGAEDFRMVSADQELGAACVSLGMTVLNPQDPSALLQLRSARR